MKRLVKVHMFLCMLVFSMFFCSAPNAKISSITIDAKTGEVIESNNADALRYPASLTKIMTLYITFDALDKGLLKMSDKLPVSRNAANRSPSKLGLRAGEKIKVEDAILALVVKSANDCATVLAEGLGYTEENFAQTMTKVANELGMTNTTFKNASGLPHSQQKTTARDMALLGAAIYHHFPQYYPLFSTKEFTYNDYTYYTHNRLLKTFEGTDGMKTGFTNAAGYNIVTSAERDGQRIIAVTMGHRQLKARDKEVTKLMDSGLVKLSMADKVKDSNIFAQLEEKPAKPETKLAGSVKVKKPEPENKETDKEWGIQIGAFSNYTKARNYALEVKEELKNRLKDKSIDIEAVEKDSAIVYRSKIVSFAENDANEVCNRLKKSNKSCIVVAVNKQSGFELANVTVARNRNQQ